MRTFILTPEHIALLRASYVEWQDYGDDAGAAAINCKRPYGNKIVARDIHRILTGEILEDENGWTLPLPEGAEARYKKLHAETEQALQVVLSTGMFVPGVYDCADMTNRWVRRPVLEASLYANAFKNFQDTLDTYRDADRALHAASGDLDNVRESARQAHLDVLLVYDRVLRACQRAGIVPTS